MSENAKSKGKKLKDEEVILVNIKDTQYPIIGTVVSSLGDSWRTTTAATSTASAITSSTTKCDFNIYWTDSGLNIDAFIKKLKGFQRVNHFL